MAENIFNDHFKIKNKHALVVSDVETCNFYSEKF